jgi:hypothetical protein
MTATHASVLLWAPRIAGVALSLVLALFALDAFNDRPFVEAVPGFLVHLIPAFLVLASVALSWRHPAAGAVTFPLLALIYAVSVHWRPDWVAVIGGPLVAVGVLFFLSRRVNDRSEIV